MGASETGSGANVLQVGGPLHGARIRMEHLATTMVLVPPGPKRHPLRSVYVHQYETFEAQDGDRHMVSPPELSHSEILGLANRAARKEPRLPGHPA